jgi:hypothetical protein
MNKIAAARKTVSAALTPERLMKVSEAAMVAGLNPETLRRRIRLGQLRAWGFPRRVLIEDVLPPVLVETTGE